MQPGKGEDRAAIIIMPRASSAWVGSEALWITAAGWAAAAKRILGHAWVVTSDRIAQPEEALLYPIAKEGQSSTGATWIPSFIRTIAKDIQLWRRSRHWKVLEQQPWKNHNVALVWQQHDLFAGPGRKLADSLGVPLVTYIHAPIVWEASQWGVKRYVWGKFLEYFFERNSLRQSDVVACVSEEVAVRLRMMGIDPARIIVSPMSVDAALFKVTPGDHPVRKRLGLDNKLVFGWTGSFRAFHGLESLIRSFSKVASRYADARLVLVGDGAERGVMEALVAELQLQQAVVFAGRIPFVQVPGYVAAFDIAVVSAAVGSFHYSPLKLREYLAAGCAVVAPRVGEVARLFRDGADLLLYEPGNDEAMANQMTRLVEDQNLRKQIAANGSQRVLETGTWDHELLKIMSAIKSPAA